MKQKNRTYKMHRNNMAAQIYTNMKLNKLRHCDDL